MKNKFSKDPKVKLVSIEDFILENEYLLNADKYLFVGEAPDYGFYYKFTSKYLIRLFYDISFINFGMDLKEKLSEIIVAKRDGTTEYSLFNKRLEELICEKNSSKTPKSFNFKIARFKKRIKSLNKLFPEFNENENKLVTKSFNDYLIDTGIKDLDYPFDKKIIIFDVETNGTRKANDDLLSISFYDPKTGMCYNRYLPLDLQPLVLTTYINGIRDETLFNESHMTQSEADNIIEYFDLKNSILMSYSGGQGTFDSSFLINYCRRHNIHGFDDLIYDNIKKYVPQGGFGTESQLTKDNLCRILGINGVSNIHSSMNDCILEWKLFREIYFGKYFFIREHLFKYNPKYIIPVTYLNAHPELIRYASIELPKLTGMPELIYEFSLPNSVLDRIKKFSTNISGITIENAINSLLKAEKQNNIDFLSKNRSNLEYIGSLNSRIESIPVIEDVDGTIISLDQKYDDIIEEVNKVTNTIMDNISPLISFIKNSIFKNERILSQELVVTSDRKLLALCDLSSNTSVLEIKTYGIIDNEGLVDRRLTSQLFIQSKNRKTYGLSININTHYEEDMTKVTDSVNFSIYKINILEKQREIKPIIKELMDWEYSALMHIVNNPMISNAEIARLDGRSGPAVGRTINLLWNLGYIYKPDNKRNTPWQVLKTDRTYSFTPIYPDN